jgi:hypothetical protein
MGKNGKIKHQIWRQPTFSDKGKGIEPRLTFLQVFATFSKTCGVHQQFWRHGEFSNRYDSSRTKFGNLAPNMEIVPTQA